MACSLLGQGRVPTGTGTYRTPEGLVSRADWPTGGAGRITRSG
ncbi:hypothetical protein AB0C81_19650 [Streptomyces roseoverticillatus]